MKVPEFPEELSDTYKKKKKKNDASLFSFTACSSCSLACYPADNWFCFAAAESFSHPIFHGKWCFSALLLLHVERLQDGAVISPATHFFTSRLFVACALLHVLHE